MTAIIVKGNVLAQKIKHKLLLEVQALKEPPRFHIIYVGSDPVIDNYLSYKQKFAHDIGVELSLHRCKESIDPSLFLKQMQDIINKGEPMIIQLPLPSSFDSQAILNKIPSELDVDVLSESSKKLFASGKNPLTPPVTASIVEIFKQYELELTHKKITVLGFGKLVGQAICAWLTYHDYPYRLIIDTTDNEERKEALQEADIIISGVGVPHLIDQDDVKEGVIIIDAGTSESERHIKGDVNPNVRSIAKLFTPVPGGIGPMTIALLYKNVVSVYKNR